MLGVEEERVIDIEEVALIRSTPEQAKLGPALMELERLIKSSASYIANLHDEDFPAFWEYKFTDMIKTMDNIFEAEMD